MCVFCSIWTLGLAQGMIQDAVYRAKSVFDPSSYSIDTIQCHAGCGDDYYTCSIIRCDSNVKSLAETAAEADDNTYFAKNQPSLWSRFLYFFTFGLLGSTSYEEDTITSVYSEEMDLDLEESGKLDQLCMKNCTKVFRKCYRKCICDANPDASECKPIIKVFPETFAPLQNKFGGFVPDQNKNDKFYSFDWSKFL
ncbi:uncharacterized protein LOC123559710 isoform X2 [Mercenaria mercenaria]|uniref:uncharacterized protein LOC123559710 isoform X2 n=1 Tax=Mercenaria mercenaria TaxID=6596 RepID=UPI00234EDBAC|nr:uncharacterized protein LOC123559710 isoform X2 [Mercenaria mercenaria]